MNTGTIYNSTNTTYSESGCLRVPPWYPQGNIPYWHFALMTLQIQLVVVFTLTQGLHRLFFKHLGLPPLVSQLMAGIILSPTVFSGRIKALETAHQLLFPEISDQVWKTLSMLGLSLSLFLIAVKMDFGIIRRTGRKPVAIGLLVFILPIIVNTVVAVLYAHFTHLTDVAQLLDISTCAAVLALTTLPVIAILLNDLKLLNSELGRLALSVGIVSELGSTGLLIISKTMLIVMSSRREKKEALISSLGVIAAILFVIFIIRPWMNQIIKHTPKGRPVKTRYLLLAFMLMLVAAILTDVSREYVMLGSYFAGAAIPEGPPLGSAIVDKLETLILGIFLPFFISTSTMRADVFKINFRDSLVHGQVLVTLSAFSTKIIICLACGLFYNMTVYDSLALAAILSSKGILDISSYNLVNQSQMIHDSSFSFLILVTTITAFIVPTSIKHFYHPRRKYAGYQRRDIIHCAADTPLRILACICRPDNVSAITNLLSLSSITRENPIILNVLHLIQLVGRAQPVFISHDLQQKMTRKSMHYSEDVIWGLKKFRKAYMNGLPMHLFTIVSPPMAMHDDICTFALDKLTFLIILPFHRKINIDGSLNFEDHKQRVLNKSVLEQAPCSVGILVDRGKSRLPTGRRPSLTSVLVEQPEQKDEYFVAVIFIGGSDDREAVAYAKRMAKGERVRVLVIRIIALGDKCGLTLLDSSTLSIIQELSSSNPQFKYREKVVRDGAETARLLKCIAGDFDLIIVGRRYDEMDCPQTSSLKEWSDVPEIGIIGDLLASPHLRCRTSILVIQQQKSWTWKDYAT